MPVNPLKLHMGTGPGGLDACSIHATTGPEPVAAIVGNCRFVFAPTGVGVLTMNSSPSGSPSAKKIRPLMVASLLSAHATKKSWVPAAEIRRRRLILNGLGGRVHQYLTHGILPVWLWTRLIQFLAVMNGEERARHSTDLLCAAAIGFCYEVWL